MNKILIIEDDQLVGSIYRHKFQAEGFEVELAGDGESGLQAVFSFKPHLVILDLMLPKLNGVEVLQSIRSHAEFKALPVLVLSNAYMSNLIQDARKAGANNCLIKASCTPKQLIAVVHQTLQGGNAASTPAASLDQTAASPGAPTAKAPDDTEFLAELRSGFANGAPATLSQLRALLQTFVKGEGDEVRLPALYSLYRKMHSVTSNAAVAGLNAISQMASAIEALLKELYDKPKNINASTIRTLAHAVDFLGLLLGKAATVDLRQLPPPKILVVDDEILSRRAVIHALERAQLSCTNVDDPDAALKLLAENQFDLIFLDVDMPGMSGFDLCSRLRTYPTNPRTPVIFVTGLTDFESRARSTLSGGSDLIAKPFLFMELAVKAMNHVLQSQLDQGGT